MGHPRRAARFIPGALDTPKARWRPWPHWRLIPLVLMGLSAPGALGQALGGGVGVTAPGVNDATCRTMNLPLVYAITLAVALGTFVGLFLVKRRLTKEGWSLANALSEPTRLSIPVEGRWTDAAGDRLSLATDGVASRKVLRASDGTAMAVMLLEASSSRMIATLGGLGILMLYMGFGTFALYSFGLTCQLPASMPAVNTFLLSGMSLFAPYVANKVSTAIQPRVRGANPPDPPPQPATPETDPPPAPETPPSSAAAPSPASTAASDRRPLPAPAPPPHRQSPQTVEPASAPSHADAFSQTYGPALTLIRSFEGFASQAYPDPASGAEPWTIGYGFTTLAGQGVQPGQTITRAEADAELERQAQACADHLAGTIPYWGQMSGNQRCALLDFAWNLGADFYGDTANFASISRDLHNRDWDEVPQTFLLYCDPGTAVEAGLRRRREAEADLWRTPAPSEPSSTTTPSSARAVSPATPPAASPARAPAPAAALTNPLKVPYCDQLQMADGQGWRECFTASSAMLAMYWGKAPNEDVYDRLRTRYGDSTSSEAQLDALRSLGLQANFLTDGTAAMLQAEIDAGRPVAVGWLCDGPVSDPSGGGHWSVIIGYDDTGFFINDPYGNCDLVNGGYLSHHDGAGLHYSTKNWLPRWRVGGSGGWMLTCRL